MGRARVCFTHGGRTHQTFIFHSKRIAEALKHPHLSGSVYVTSQSFPINFSSLTCSSTGPRVLFYRRVFASSIVFFVLHLLVLLPMVTPVLTSKNLTHACGPPLFRSLTGYPPQLRTYTLALNDELLPLIQGLRNADGFSLITILELPGCDALTDNNVAELRCLHALAAFDASNTELSSHGIVTLSRTLSINDPSESTRKLRGPWSLRILRLKHCSEIDNAVYHVFSSFPLLTVIGGCVYDRHHDAVFLIFRPSWDEMLPCSDFRPDVILAL